MQINERLSGITSCPGLTLLNVRELSSCCCIKSFVLDGDTGADLLTESVFNKFGDVFPRASLLLKPFRTMQEWRVLDGISQCHTFPLLLN